jgi:phospholipase/lecithinase/hemolysin
VIAWIRVLAAGAALALLAVSPALAVSSYSNLYVFGDSLVDAGNVSVITGGTTPNPAQGYYNGRFSNGPVASDVVNAAIEGTLAAPSLTGGDNYAYGGARARNDGLSVPDVAAQVSSYLTNVGGLADPNALYLINAGGNDVFDILAGGSAPAIISAAVTAIVTQVSVLQAAGAQYFLIAGVGNVGGTPGAISAGAGAIGLLLSQQLTSSLFAALPSSPNILKYDTIALFNSVVANPAAYGLPVGINLTTACLASGSPDPSGPPSCNDYAFFDNTHPTTQVASILGNAWVVAAVPEPDTSSLLAIGLLVLALRRSRTR